MKKSIYVFAALCMVCMAFADDHIIQFVLSNGRHISFRTSEVTSISYDYHNQDSIDEAIADSIRNIYLRDSLYRDSLYKDSIYRDSLILASTLNYKIDSAKNYTIFAEALHRTGLMDSIARYEQKHLEFSGNHYRIVSAHGGDDLYPAYTWKLGFTIFAETDSVMRLNGINDIEDLVAFANKTYGEAPEWYDFMRANGLTVSTGNDYTNRQNALNMFVAYHILAAAISPNEIVFEKDSNPYWNYKPDADVYDYYETMLPHTLLKAWMPYVSGRRIFLNRYQTNNTLTNQTGTTGTNHELVREGTEVLRSEGSVTASNGYIHPIGGMLVYDRLVPKGVLNERMRFNCTSLFPELITNGWRSAWVGDPRYPDYIRVGVPNNFSSNMVVYSPMSWYDTTYALHGEWRAYQSDMIHLFGQYDMAIKLPAVPAGLYELRWVYTTINFAIVEVSIGTNPYQEPEFADDGIKLKDYEVLDTIDYSILPADPRIGLTDALAESDRGIASDKLLRQRGFMRAPYSYCGHALYGWSESNNCRNEFSIATLRKIIARIETDGQSQWLRIRRIPNSEALIGAFPLDFIELCPVSVCDNSEYMEDWY